MEKCVICFGASPCARCGELLTQSLYCLHFTESERNFIPTDVYFTSKYIISKKVGLPLFIGISFTVGAEKSFTGYDISKLKDIIYPVKPRGVKKNCALQFVDISGGDFFVSFKNAKLAAEAYGILQSVYISQ